MIPLLIKIMTKEFGAARVIAELDHPFANSTETFLEVKSLRDSSWRRIATVNLAPPYSQSIISLKPCLSKFAEDFDRANAHLPLLPA